MDKGIYLRLIQMVQIHSDIVQITLYFKIISLLMTLLFTGRM